MVAALIVGGFVMAPERHRRHGARHLADDHGLMAERVVIRSYRRVFEVDRRIYRVDRWALPVPGGVPLRAVGYFAATLLAVIVAGSLPGIGELVGAAVAAAAVRRGAAGGRGARHAGGAGRAHGAPVRVGLAAVAAAGAAALGGPRGRARGRAGALGRRAGGALGRRRAELHRGARARAGAGDVQRAGRLARPAGARRAAGERGEAVVLCGDRCWRCGRERGSRCATRIRTSSSARATRGRRCSASTRSPIRSWRRPTSASGCGGWRGSRSRSRPTSRSGASAAPTRPSATPSRRWRCSTSAAQSRGGVAVLPERARGASARAALVHARGLPRGLAAGADALVRGVDRIAPARRGRCSASRIRCRSPASEIDALVVAEERAFRRAEACLPVRRATTRELQWLLRRAACRGVAEPALDDHWEPSALIVETADGQPAYEPLGTDIVRHANAPILEQDRALVVDAEEGRCHQAHARHGRAARGGRVPGRRRAAVRAAGGAAVPGRRGRCTRAGSATARRSRACAGGSSTPTSPSPSSCTPRTGRCPTRPRRTASSRASSTPTCSRTSGRRC